MAASTKHQFYSITIFANRKEGMDEHDYHDYISNIHAGRLKSLLAEKGVVSYTMQHNTSETNRPLLQKIFGNHLPDSNVADCDAVIQIVFRDVEDYLRVREDPLFINVVNPDHVSFADPKRTTFACGWFEAHVQDGKVDSRT